MKKVRALIKSDNDNKIATNGNQEIDAQDVHSINEDIVDSMLMSEDVVNDVDAGGENIPISAEVVKNLNSKVEDLKKGSDTTNSQISQSLTDLTDKHNQDISKINQDKADKSDVYTKKEVDDSIDDAIDENIKIFDTTGRLRYDPSNKHFYFEVLAGDGQTWITKTEIGKSIIVDALRLIKSDKPTDIIQGEIAFYNKEITLPDGKISVRSHFVLEDGSEYSFVVSDSQTNEIVFRTDTGELIHIPYVYIDEKDNELKDFDKIKFSGNVKVTKEDKILNVEILDSGSGDVNFIDDSTAHLDKTYSSVKINSLIPAADDVVSMINTKLGSTNWQGGNVDVTSILDDLQESLSKTYSSNKIESLITEVKGLINKNKQDILRVEGLIPDADKIVQEINEKLGSTDWQNGGGGIAPVVERFTAYYGFYHLPTIVESAVKKLPTSTYTNPINNYSGSQTNPPNYFYIVVPKNKADLINTVAQSPSHLGAAWTKQEVIIDSENYVALRSPNKMYDRSATFKTIA